MDKRNIKPKNKRGLIVILLALLCSFACITVGFASWITVGGVNSSLDGDIDAENAKEVENPIELFSVTKQPVFSSLSGYGFLINEEYVLSITLSWEFSFDALKASNYIESMKSNQVWFSASLSVTPTIVSQLSISSMTLNSEDVETPVVYQQTYNNKTVNIVNNGTSINQQWNITEVDNTNSIIPFTLTIPISFTGTKSNFPNLNTNQLTLSLYAGEYKNE